MDVKTGDVLRQLRRDNGYSRAQVAAIVGVREQDVETWERTASYPDADKLVALATLYHRSVDEIVARDGE